MDDREQQKFWEDVCREQLDTSPLYWLRMVDDLAPDEVIHLQLATARSASDPYKEPAPLPTAVDREKLHKVLVQAMKMMDAGDDLKQEMRSIVGDLDLDTGLSEDLFNIRLLSDIALGDIARLRVLALVRRLPGLTVEDQELFSRATASLVTRMKPFADRTGASWEGVESRPRRGLLSRLFARREDRQEDSRENLFDARLEAKAVLQAIGYLRGLSLGITPDQGVQLEQARLAGEPSQEELLKEFRTARSGQE